MNILNSQAFLKWIDNIERESAALVPVIRVFQTFVRLGFGGQTFGHFNFVIYCACQILDEYSNCFSLVKWVFDCLLPNILFQMLSNIFLNQMLDD